jgi:hypothetical protein
LGQQTKQNNSKEAVDETRLAINQQEVIARLFGIANELKGEAEKPAAALLQAEVADVLWRFDEPAARSIFRVAFDNVRQTSPDDTSSDRKAKSDAAKLARRRTSALKTILKRYGFHDRKESEAWLQEFESEIKAEKTTPGNSGRMSQEQAELLASIALGLVTQDPKEAQRLGLRSLSAEEIPSAFGPLLMSLRSADKSLGDLLWRQAILAMRTWGFNYDKALFSLTNYEFFSDGRPFPGVSPTDVGLIIQYFVDAASVQAARWRSVSTRADEQAARGRFFSFLTSRAVPIVARNSPDKLALLQSNVAELAQGLSIEQRQQAEMLASMASQSSAPLDGNDSDIESRVHRAEQEKNSSIRNFRLRDLVLWLMRSDPEQALSVAGKIDDQDMRAQTEDDVYLVMMQKVFIGSSFDAARSVALKFNDPNRRARWLAQIANRISPRSKDHTETADLLSQAYSIAAKSDNTPVKLEVLLLIAKEFLSFDRDRGFEILSEAVNTANRLEAKVPAKTNLASFPTVRVITITMVDGKEVSTDDRATVDSIDFNEISAFADRDYLETSLMGGNLKDRFLRAKYLIALARTVLKVPRQGSGYERTQEDLLGN